MIPLLDKLTKALDPDKALQVAMDGLIEATAVRYALDPKRTAWRPGEPLKILLAGYTGTRNTGADVRVEEMIRQFRHVLGDENAALSICTMDPERSAGYFRTVRQVHMPQIFPKFLFDECPRHHGVVACEGSMFKSKFASALTTFMAGALGMANAEGKLSVGYGAEAGDMNPSLREFVRKHVKQSLVICRNEPSRHILEDMGIRTRSGADTAWTFVPSPPEVGREILRRHGWDGQRKVLIVCPINPFWWPVKPDLLKAAAHRFGGQFKQEHYKSVYFHHRDEETEAKYDAYLQGLADAVNAFGKDRPIFPVMVGMEALDRRACEHLAERIPGKVPVIVSDEHDMYDLVSVLRQGSYMVSSRFHAIVTSMPGLVPSIGVTMDERIRNLLTDRGHTDILFEVDEEALGEKVLSALRRVERDTEAVQDAIARAVPRQLALMGQMGIDFADEVARLYPDLPRRDLPRTWEGHLPPLAPELRELVERAA